MLRFYVDLLRDLHIEDQFHTLNSSERRLLHTMKIYTIKRRSLTISVRHVKGLQSVSLSAKFSMAIFKCSELMSKHEKLVHLRIRTGRCGCRRDVKKKIELIIILIEGTEVTRVKVMATRALLHPLFSLRERKEYRKIL